MTRTNLVRIGIGLAAAILAATGFPSWRPFREAGRRKEFLEEIGRARAAHRRPEPAVPTKEERETAAMYERAAALFQPDLVTDEFQVEIAGLPWTEPPPAATAFVEGHAPMLALMEQAASRRSCRFADDGILRRTKIYRFPTLLEAKGHLDLQRRDFPAVVRTIILFRRVAEDLGRIPLTSGLSWFGIVDGLAQKRAAELLSELATAQGLDGAAAVEALAASLGPWEERVPCYNDADGLEEFFDSNCVRLLEGGDMEKTDPDWLAMVRPEEEKAVGGRAEDGPIAVPSVDRLRVLREAFSKRLSVERRWEAAAGAPGGSWREALSGTPAGGGDPGRVESPPPWFRGMLKARSRIAVGRTAIAVRSFQIREGRPPAALDELVPGTVAAVPVDPFDGKPLAYEAGPGGGWTIRSRTWPEESFTADGEPEAPLHIEAKFPRPAR